MISTYDKQLRTLKRENKALKKRLSYFEEFNQNDQKFGFELKNHRIQMNIIPLDILIKERARYNKSKQF